MSKSAEDTLAALFAAAKAAQGKAYTPYSRFNVGAAILAPNGVIYAGCNVENAAYPQGACAETGAIAAMALAGERLFQIFVGLATCEISHEIPPAVRTSDMWGKGHEIASRNG